MLHPHAEPMRRPRSPFVHPALELRRALELAALQMSWPASPVVVSLWAPVSVEYLVFEFAWSLELVQLHDQFVLVHIRAR